MTATPNESVVLDWLKQVEALPVSPVEVFNHVPAVHFSPGVPSPLIFADCVRIARNGRAEWDWNGRIRAFTAEE